VFRRHPRPAEQGADAMTRAQIAAPDPLALEPEA